MKIVFECLFVRNTGPGSMVCIRLQQQDRVIDEILSVSNSMLAWDEGSVQPRWGHDRDLGSRVTVLHTC